MKKRFRDAISGRFTKVDAAAAHPHTTVAETIDDRDKELAKLKWRLATCEAVMREVSGDLRNAVMHHSIQPDRLSKWATQLEDTALDRKPPEEEQA